VSRPDIVSEARDWLGTPYCHQASLKGQGCDCLGLIRGIWRVCVGDEPEDPPPYLAGQIGQPGDTRLNAAFDRHFQRVALSGLQPGHVLLFRPREDGPACHCAVLSCADAIIHAYWNRSVVETPLSKWWRRRLVAAFAFPERRP
jgi:NlpC/P60 family putative phage cell wall peptidase